MADLHFSVQKDERDNRTHTKVTPLTREDRIFELARLTGGSHLSEAMQHGARELLETAEEYKNKM